MNLTDDVQVIATRVHALMKDAGIGAHQIINLPEQNEIAFYVFDRRGKALHEKPGRFVRIGCRWNGLVMLLDHSDSEKPELVEYSLKPSDVERAISDATLFLRGPE